MTAICLYAQVHQPFRLRPYRLFDIGTGTDCFDTEQNRAILRRVAEKCYLPANRLLADLIRRSQGEFRLALSLSGTLLDQLAAWAPDVLQSFQELVATGGVELLGEGRQRDVGDAGAERRDQHHEGERRQRPAGCLLVYGVHFDRGHHNVYAVHLSRGSAMARPTKSKRRTPLTKQRIVEVAVATADADGLESPCE